MAYALRLGRSGENHGGSNPSCPTMLIDELKAATYAASVYVAKDAGHIRIEGPDASSFLHAVTTNDVMSLAAGQGQHSAVLDRKGKVRSLFYLFRMTNELFHLTAKKDTVDKISVLLQEMIFSEQLSLADVTNETSLVMLFGPHAKNQGEKLDEKIACVEDPIYSIPCWRVLLPRKGGLPFHELQQLSSAAVDCLRMEKGIPEYGIDVDENNILLEGNLSHAYARNKGCYPGQEVIERLHTYAKGQTPSMVVCMTKNGKLDVQKGMLIETKKGDDVGVVTSFVYHPLKNVTYIMARVVRKHFVPSELVFSS